MTKAHICPYGDICIEWNGCCISNYDWSFLYIIDTLVNKYHIVKNILTLLFCIGYKDFNT